MVFVILPCCELRAAGLTVPEPSGPSPFRACPEYIATTEGGSVRLLRCKIRLSWGDAKPSKITLPAERVCAKRKCGWIGVRVRVGALRFRAA